MATRIRGYLSGEHALNVGDLQRDLQPCLPWSLLFHSKGLQTSKDLPVFSKRGFVYVRNLMSFPLSGGKGGLLCSRFCVNSKILNLWVFFCHRDSPFSLITSPQGREGGMKNYMVIALNNNDL